MCVMNGGLGLDARAVYWHIGQISVQTIDKGYLDHVNSWEKEKINKVACINWYAAVEMIWFKLW